MESIGLPAPLNDVAQGRRLFMASHNIKAPADYPDQIKKLIEHGFVIEDHAACERFLSQVSYYRFSAYFQQYKTAAGKYQPSIPFEKIRQIYEFDRELRSLVFSAIEEVEINLRTKMSHYHAMKYGALGYLDQGNFNGRHNHKNFVALLQREIRNKQQTPFVRHHITNYGGQFPLWVVVELFTFGMLSYFYADLKRHDQRAFASIVGAVTADKMLSWLRCITDLRNICAHYGRLYNLVFPAIPLYLPPALHQSERKLFASIWAMRHLFPDSEKWHTDFIMPLSRLIRKYKRIIDLNNIGFPKDWLSYLEP
jgi:abortive infection bacteriophage resistance protein